MFDDQDFDFDDFLSDDEWEDSETSANVEDDDPMEQNDPARKSMVLFFLIDVSTSMKGERIDAMNKVMSDILPGLINVGGTTTEVKIAVMEFGSGFEWVTPSPVLVEQFQTWKNLEAGGVTDLGMALTELSQKMSRKEFLFSPSLSYAPVVFLITDGYPTDNYKKGLNLVKRNNWFKNGIKIAVALGKGVDMDILEEFTGDREFIVEANNSKDMVKLIRELAVTSSQIGSQSVPVFDAEDFGKELEESDVEFLKQEQMREAIKDIKKDIMSGVEDFTDDMMDPEW